MTRKFITRNLNKRKVCNNKTRNKMLSKRFVKKRRPSNKKSKKGKRRMSGGALNREAVQTVETQLINRESRHSNMLNLVCSDADNCLALGEYGGQIKSYFDNFSKFELIDKAAAHVLNAGNNGVVVSLPFRKNGYTAHVAFKCATTKDSDHLYYEYLVGTQFINRFLERVPCFVETYKLYEFKSPYSSNQCIELAKNQSGKTGFEYDFQQGLKPVNDANLLDERSVNMSCLNGSTMYCIFIQHFNRFKSSYSLLSQMDLYQKCCMLLQVYFGLNVVNSDGCEYTHYDLHANNVFAYSPYKDPSKLIHFRYHMPNGDVLKFNSPYVFKIIDYGRNYFNNGSLNSNDFIEKMCEQTTCEYCGGEVGYATIQGFSNKAEAQTFHWINPRYRNLSHDLLFAYYVLGKSFIVHDDDFGTPEVLEESTDGRATNINSCIAMIYNQLKNLQSNNPQLSELSPNAVATLDVFCYDKPYVFTLLPHQD